MGGIAGDGGAPLEGVGAGAGEFQVGAVGVVYQKGNPVGTAHLRDAPDIGQDPVIVGGGHIDCAGVRVGA